MQVYLPCIHEQMLYRKKQIRDSIRGIRALQKRFRLARSEPCRLQIKITLPRLHSYKNWKKSEKETKVGTTCQYGSQLVVQFIPCVRLGQRTDALPMLTLLSQQKSPHTICEQGHAKNNKTTSLAVSLEA